MSILVAVTIATINAVPAQAGTGTTSGNLDTLTLVDNLSTLDFVNGEGTSHLTFGFNNEPTNLLEFTGASFNTEPGTPFVLGQFTYANGIVFLPDGQKDGILTSNLSVSSVSADPGFNQTFTEQIRLDATVNLGINSLSDADIIFFPSRPELGSFRVFEGASATVQLLGEFGSLELVGFGEVISGSDTGFVFPGIDRIPDTTIPEYSSVASFILFGAFGAGFMLKRNLKRK